MIEVAFYFPEPCIVDAPSRSADFAAWLGKLARDGATLGPSVWTVQTFLQLKERGLRCHLTSELPRQAIVVAHRTHFPRRIELRRDRFWVCLLADRDPHPYANFHVVQNPTQTLRCGQDATYIPHWPQPGLLPRCKTRGTALTNVCFFGERDNLASELCEDGFEAWCDSHGMKFVVVPRDRWHDYSDCDVALAIRSFGSHQWHHTKPATKLFNAWLAEVPAILGSESAYRVEGRRGENYLEALGVADVYSHLKSLASDWPFRERLVTTGREAAAHVTADAVADKWLHAIEEVFKPRFASWHRGFLVQAPLLGLLGRVREGLVWRYSLVSSSFRP